MKIAVHIPNLEVSDLNALNKLKATRTKTMNLLFFSFHLATFSLHDTSHEAFLHF